MVATNIGLGQVKELPGNYNPAIIGEVLQDMVDRIVADLIAGNTHDGGLNRGPAVAVGGAYVGWKQGGSAVLDSANFNNSVTGLTLSNDTSVAKLALSSGYVIPTTTEESNWNTAYGWGNHSGLYVLLASGSSQTIDSDLTITGVGGKTIAPDILNVGTNMFTVNIGGAQALAFGGASAIFSTPDFRIRNTSNVNVFTYGSSILNSIADHYFTAKCAFATDAYFSLVSGTTDVIRANDALWIDGALQFGNTTREWQFIPDGDLDGLGNGGIKLQTIGAGTAVLETPKIKIGTLQGLLMGESGVPGVVSAIALTGSTSDVLRGDGSFGASSVTMDGFDLSLQLCNQVFI